MIDAAAWEAFAGVAAVVVLLGGVALALQRLGLLPQRPRQPPTDAAAKAERLHRLELAAEKFRGHVGETYVRRDDWTPWASRIEGRLEQLVEAVARLDERTAERAAERTPRRATREDGA